MDEIPLSARVARLAAWAEVASTALMVVIAGRARARTAPQVRLNAYLGANTDPQLRFKGPRNNSRNCAPGDALLSTVGAFEPQGKRLRAFTGVTTNAAEGNVLAGNEARIIYYVFP